MSPCERRPYLKILERKANSTGVVSRVIILLPILSSSSFLFLLQATLLSCAYYEKSEEQLITDTFVLNCCQFDSGIIQLLQSVFFSTRFHQKRQELKLVRHYL